LAGPEQADLQALAFDAQTRRPLLEGIAGELVFEQYPRQRQPAGVAHRDLDLDAPAGLDLLGRAGALGLDAAQPLARQQPRQEQHAEQDVHGVGEQPGPDDQGRRQH
jgi:hypothetical protein